MSRRVRHSLPGVLCVLLVLAPPWMAQAAEESNAIDRRVTEALALWKRDDTRARHEALHRLERLGPRAAGAVPALIPGLADRDARIRRKTAEVLRRIGAPANRAVPALITALNDPAKEVRTAAARALMTTKPDPKEVIPALVASLRAGPSRRCPMSAYVFGTLGAPAVPVLIDLLKDDDPALRRMAGYALGQIGPEGRPAVPTLIEALRRLPDREAREHIAGALAGTGADAVGPLVRALRDPDPKVRGGAARAIEKLGAQAQAAVPALVAALSDPEPPDDPRPPDKSRFDGWNREGEPWPSGFYAALRAIGVAAVPRLLEDLGGPDRQARLVAMKALGFLGYDARSAVPMLIALLRDPALRGEAASALGGIGPAARSAIPPLVAALKDPEAAFRAGAAESLGRIGWSRQMAQYSSRTVARGAIAPLAAALADPDARVRAAAARALGDIGSEASVAIPQLVALFRDPAADARAAAVRTFLRVGDIPRPALGTVAGLLSDTDRRVRLAAATIIEDDNLATDVIIEGLLAALRDPDADVRAEAAYRLARTNGREGIAVAVNSVTYGYGDSEALARSQTAGAVLRAALADPDPRVRAGVAYV